MTTTDPKLDRPFFDKKIADWALDTVTLLVEHLMRLEDSPAVHIAIAFRAFPPGEEIITERTIGDLSKSPWPIVDLANNKLQQTIRSGKPSRYVQFCAPQFLDLWDAAFSGSAILDDVAAGVSDVSSERDEAIAHAVIALCIAACMEKRRDLVSTMSTKACFFDDKGDFDEE